MADHVREQIKTVKAALDAIASDPDHSCVTVRNELEEIAEYVEVLIERAAAECHEGT